MEMRYGLGRSICGRCARNRLGSRPEIYRRLYASLADGCYRGRHGDKHGAAGSSGADFACYHQARTAGFTTTFRAFLASQVQDLDKIVHYRDWSTPVVNLKVWECNTVKPV